MERNTSRWRGKPEERERVLWKEPRGKAKEEIAAGARQRSAEHAEACGVLELERVLSCCSANRWRTELDFGSGEPFDDLHRSTAPGAAPKMTGVLGAGSVWL